MNKRRLLKLAAFLEKLPPSRFLYDEWVGDEWKGKRDLSCGTSACALGWATTIPEFAKAGLRLKKDIFGSAYVTIRGFRETGENDPSTVAGMRIFGLTERQFDYLFIPQYEARNVSAKQIVRRIRRFVKRDGVF